MLIILAMILEHDEYTVSRKTLEVVLEALNANWFRDDGHGDEYNNEDVIAATKQLETELEKQQ